MTEQKHTDAVGMEEFSGRVGEGTEFAAEWRCYPIGDEDTGSMWIGSIYFDNDLFNWPQVIIGGANGETIRYFQAWNFPGEKSSGAYLMNLLLHWHEEIVEFIQRLRNVDLHTKEG